MSTQREKRPGAKWERREMTLLRPATLLSVSWWSLGKVFVCSALENAELPDRSGVGPQWHISISRSGVRPSATDVAKALRAFGMVGSEEDNHQPGVARHFWLPVDPAHRVDCECKEDEDTIVEPDGYRWTNPNNGEPCRGCEFQQQFGKPCPVHVTGDARIEPPAGAA